MATLQCFSLRRILMWMSRCQYHHPVIHPGRLAIRHCTKPRMSFNQIRNLCTAEKKYVSSVNDEVSKNSTAYSKYSSTIFMEYNNSISATAVSHIVEQIRTCIFDGKKEHNFVVVSFKRSWMSDDVLQEFEKAGATVIVTHIDNWIQMLQLMYKFACDSDPSVIIIISKCHFFWYYIRSFIYEYGHKVVFISSHNNGHAIPSQKCQFIDYDYFVADLREINRSVLCSRNLSSLKIDLKEVEDPLKVDFYSYLEASKQTAERSRDITVSDVPIKCKERKNTGNMKETDKEDDDLNNENILPNLCIIRGFPTSASKSHILKYLNSQKTLLPHNFTVTAFDTSTGTVVLQFNSKESSIRAVRNFNQTFEFGSKLSASLVKLTVDNLQFGPPKASLPNKQVQETTTNSMSEQSIPLKSQQLQVAPPQTDDEVVVHRKSMMQVPSKLQHLQLTPFDCPGADKIDNLNYNLLLKRRIVEMIKVEPGKMIMMGKIYSEYYFTYNENMKLKRSLLSKLLDSTDGVKIKFIAGEKYVCLEDSSDNKQQQSPTEQIKEVDDGATHPKTFSSLRKTLKKFLT